MFSMVATPLERRHNVVLPACGWKVKHFLDYVLAPLRVCTIVCGGHDGRNVTITMAVYHELFQGVKWEVDKSRLEHSGLVGIDLADASWD